MLGVKNDIAPHAAVVQEREIIRLWHQLRFLEREGRSVTMVIQQIEKALAERKSHAA
jgi:hypothetical protein